jgi:hypothetical protein
MKLRKSPPLNFGKRRQDWFDTYHLPEGGVLRIDLKIVGPQSVWTLTCGEKSVIITNHDILALGLALVEKNVLAIFTPEQATYYRQFVIPLMIEPRLQQIYGRIQQEKFTLKNWPLARRKKGLGPLVCP